MVAFNTPLDPNSVDTSSIDFPPLPAGEYHAKLNGEKANNRGSFDFEFQILNGEYAGRKIWQSVDVFAAEDWKGRKLCAQLANAHNLGAIQSTDILMGREYGIKLNAKPAKKDPSGKIYNNIVDVQNSGQGAAQPQQATTPPQQTQQAPSTPPWGQ